MDVNPIFGLSLLLAAGFGAARLVKLLHLPSVTGYIIAGIALGPAGLGLLSSELLESDLTIFTSIALLLIAFGIGERFDLGQLRHSARTVAAVSAAEVAATFALVAMGVGAVAWATGAGEAHAGPRLWISVALVCGSIAVATAPAATVAVIRELGASGPISRLVLSNVVVNNALSVTTFGIAAAVARVLLGTGSGSGVPQVVEPILKTAGALVLGLGIGLTTDLIVHKLHERADVLVVALTAVFLCGGLADFLGLSPLLMGVAAGFAVVNRDRRDVRAFRALNDFEPPLYGIFFALAGAQLHLPELVAAGAVGLVFVLCRAAGKCFGAWVGASSVGMPAERARFIGLGLLPQAGLAIGLAYLVRQDPSLEPIQMMVINVVVASVVINELLGPPLVRWMIVRAGEVPAGDPGEAADAPASELGDVEVVPWTWPKLKPRRRPDGFVIAGLSHPLTVPGVTRMATLLSHHYGAWPMGVHVVTGEVGEGFWTGGPDRRAVRLFRLALREARNLGYELQNEVEFAEEVSEGILRAAETQDAQAIVMGHPLVRQARLFGQTIDAVARDALCPVVVVRFVGVFHTERILVPLSGEDDYVAVHPLVCALGMVAEHQITLLRLMASETGQEELKQSEEEMAGWVRSERLPGQVSYRAVSSESRVHEILEAAEEHDVVVMGTGVRKGLRRLFLGSLAEDVAQRSPRPVILVRGGEESRPLPEVTE